MSFNCRSLAEMSEQRRFGVAVPGDGVGRRRGVCGGKERRPRRTLWWSWMGRGRPGGGSPAMYRGGGHGSSAPASSGEVGKGRLGLGASAC